MSQPGQDILELAGTWNQNLPEEKQKAEQNIAENRLEQTTVELGKNRTRGKLSRSCVQNCPASGNCLRTRKMSTVQGQKLSIRTRKLSRGLNSVRGRNRKRTRARPQSRIRHRSETRHIPIKLARDCRHCTMYILQMEADQSKVREVSASWKNNKRNQRTCQASPEYDRL